MPYLRSLGFDVLLSPWDDLRNIRSLAANARDTEGVGVLHRAPNDSEDDAGAVSDFE